MLEGNALVAAYSAPQHDRDYGSKRVRDHIEFLLEAGWSVTFIGAHGNAEPRYVRELQQRGVAVFDGRTDCIERVIQAASFDLSLLCFWPVGRLYIPVLRRLAPHGRVLIDSIDLHFLREGRRHAGESVLSDAPLLPEALGDALISELNVYGAADAALTVSDKEATMLGDILGGAIRARSVPCSEQLERSAVPFHERRGMLFVGSARHPPNLNALKFLCEEVLPLVPEALRREHPLYIVGDGMETVPVASSSEHIRTVGWVPTLEPYLARVRTTVVPLLYGAGVKGKLLQALMVGTPSVTTPVGAEGTGIEHEHHALVAQSAADFARALVRVLSDATCWQRLADRGHTHALTTFGRDAVRARFLEVVTEALATSPVASRLPEITTSEYWGRSDRAERSRVPSELRSLLRGVTPPGSRIAVISKGDDRLVAIEGREGWHFPRDHSGTYVGHHPLDAAAAIALLEDTRYEGAEYLAIPEWSRWWLDHYSAFAAHLAALYECVADQPGTGAVYSLRVESGLGRRAPNVSRVSDRTEGEPAAPTADGGERARLIAFYLPQFHPIPENDRWWGKGFTEWTNVSSAGPLFAGHQQPQVPADLGFYDLRVAETRQAQAELARAYGIEGFCYYHYWFGGKQLLERPVSEMLRSGEPDMPFCLCWANEPWSRRWDGSESEILQAQHYGPDDDVAHIRHLLPALADRRAITVDGLPMLLVYRAHDLPEPTRTIDRWRREVDRAGLPGLHLVAVETGWDLGRDATLDGFDARVLFQPMFSLLHRVSRQTELETLGLRVYDYQQAWPVLADPDPVSYRRYDSVAPAWDNTARSGYKGLVLHNSSPDAYEAWLRQAVDRAQMQPPDHRIVFLNAWNEWAEGCHLEPDTRNGLAYLEATRRAVMADERVRGSAAG